MIKSAKDYPISVILDPEQNARFIIPPYQREYTWYKPEWEELFDDLWENDPGHFMGSIICINKSTDTLQVQELELVDGQQRITTLSLLNAAIYMCLQEFESQLTEEQRLDRGNLKRRLILKADPSKTRLQLSKQHYNDADYQGLLSHIGIVNPPSPIPSKSRTRRLWKAFDYFIKRLQEVNQANERIYSIEKLFEFLTKVNSSILVKIEVDNYAIAHTLFESLNNRGVPLSAIDLIKNNLLAKIDKINPGQIEASFNSWQTILNNLGNDYKTQERFLRHFYNAFKGTEQLAHLQQTQATRTNIIEIYNNLIERDAPWLLTRLTETTALYNRLIVASNEENEKVKGLAEQIARLGRIGGAPSYQLLLYILDKKVLEDAQLIDLVGFLFKFFVRRSLTDTPPTRDLDRIFLHLISEIAQNKKDVVGHIKTSLIGKSANDKKFEESLEGNVYDDSPWVTRIMLCTLEELKRTREATTDLWKWENRSFVWTVEHIFPQGEDIPQAWVEMMAGGDRSKANEIREQYVHKLGNLTLSMYNSALGTFPFDVKQNRTNADGRYIGYKNGMYLNESLKDLEGWSVEQINTRSEQLIKELLEIFKLV